MKHLLLAASPLLLIAGCAMDGGMESSQATAGGGATATASAALAGATGTSHGTARFEQMSDGVKVTLDATAVPAGVKAIHVHTVGRCDPPSFESAGPHWNPTGRQHGTQNPSGPHTGDLPNITVAADGTGKFEGMMAGATLTGGAAPLLDADGAAFIIHAGADDYRSDPSGNSGGRIACGVLAAG